MISIRHQHMSGTRKFLLHSKNIGLACSIALVVLAFTAGCQTQAEESSWDPSALGDQDIVLSAVPGFMGYRMFPILTTLFTMMLISRAATKAGAPMDSHGEPGKMRGA